MLLRRPAKLKAGRPLHTPGSLAANPSLNPSCETSPQILLGGTHSFERHKSTVSPCAWQSNKAVLFSVQFSCSVMSDSLQPHGLQQARPPSPSPTPRVYSNSCPLSRWCHPNISPSVMPFSSCLQFFPASGSFPMSQFFTSSGQSIGVSASASVLPMNIQDWFPFRMDWLYLLAVQGTLKSLLQHHSSKVSWFYFTSLKILSLRSDSAERLSF